MIREFVRLRVEVGAMFFPTLTVVKEDWDEVLKAARGGREFHLTGLTGGHYPRPGFPGEGHESQACTMKVTGMDPDHAAHNWCLAHDDEWGEVSLCPLPEPLDKGWGSGSFRAGLRRRSR